MHSVLMATLVGVLREYSKWPFFTEQAAYLKTKPFKLKNMSHPPTPFKLHFEAGLGGKDL